ncbi:MAG: ABC transporter permease [Candidatus Acidiferrum sp.]|jgi:predicted permease
MTTLWQDLRFAIRMLAKGPGFTAVAILTLALGIGANTAIFTVIDSVLLRPLPYPQADRLVFLGEFSKEIPDMSIAMANFNDWRAQNSVFESMVAYQNNDAVLTGRGAPERLRLRRITAGFTPTMKVGPILGRTLAPEDDKVGAPRVVILSEGFWDRRFARDPGVLGQQLVIDAEPYTIIGVFPARLHGSLLKTDLFTSLWRLEDQLGGEAHRGDHPGIYAYARLRPGVTTEQARSEMTSIAARIDQLHPQTNGQDSVTIQPLLDAIVEDVRPSLILLMAAVALVLLIACVNIANLQLARASDRYKELSVRMALGAGRARLVRQLLTESMLLSLAGGLLGLLFAQWTTSALLRFVPPSIPRLNEISADRGVLAFSLVVSILTGILFGIFPALQASRADIHDALKEGGRGFTGGAGKRHARDLLVAAEVACTLILLVGAGLLTKSLWNVLRADSGVQPAHVLTARLALPDVKYQDAAKRRIFIQQLVAKVQDIPGVDAAGFKDPLLGNWQTSFVIDGRPMPPPGQSPEADMGRLTPDAMRTVGMRLLRGRFFTDHDDENTQRVCIIDNTFAKQYFANQDPLGNRISMGGEPKPGNDAHWLTIVGVVSHVKNYGVDQPSRVEAFLPNAQEPTYGGSIVVRSVRDDGSLAFAIRSAVQSLDPDLPIFDVRPFPDIIAENSASRRLSVLLIGSFAFLALLLSAVGICGVVSYLVTQRYQEIGIRMALGAAARDVLSMVLLQGARMASVGIAVGLIVSLALTRLITSMLFEVGALDVTTFAAGVAAISLLVLFACWLPARRATRVDPLVALRYE